MNIFPDWTGETVAVVGSGASAAELVPLIRGRCRMLVTNLTFRLAPDADILYAADAGFWQIYRDAHGFRGMKVAADDRARLYCSSVLSVIIPKRNGRRIDDLVLDLPGHVGHGSGNSGFQLFNIAISTGAKRILLAGLDYGGSHWHPDHPPALHNPSERQLKQWRERFDKQAGVVHDLGIEVFNLSKRSTLKAYKHGEPDSLLPCKRPTALQA